MIAIFILVTAVAVPLTIASKGVLYSNVIRDQSTASYLAQEAIEYIREQRDNQSLAIGGSWAFFANTQFGPCSFPNSCTVDVITTNITTCTSRCPVMRQNLTSATSSQLAYAYGNDILNEATWAPTKFTRSITMTEIVPGKEMKVVVTVNWQTNGVAKQFSLYEYLTNWQK